MKKLEKITEKEAGNWLDNYGTAWAKRDVELAISLFTDDADYRERRFGPPLLGHPTLKTYWEDRIFEHQRDITFEYQLWAVKGTVCFAGWQAKFTWTPINGIVEMDGVFRLEFSQKGKGGLVCSKFDEWFDTQDS
jgi:hypothetical protein